MTTGTESISMKIEHYSFFSAIPNLPMMSVGATYAAEYIMNGTGAYLKWHDVPHLHMPLNDKCEGRLVLGVIKQDTLKLSAFRIPFGKAIFMTPYTLHNGLLLDLSFRVCVRSN